MISDPLVWYFLSGFMFYFALKFYCERETFWTVLGGWGCIGMTSLLIEALVNRSLSRYILLLENAR
jgi:hypothetical protein